MVLGTAKLMHRKSISWPIMRGGDVSKRNLKEFTIAFRKILKFRDSQLRTDRTEAKWIQMDEVAQKDFTCRLSSEEYERYKKTWSISQHICPLSEGFDRYRKNWCETLNTPMKLRSDFREALTNMHRPCLWRRATRTNSFLSIPKVAVVVLFIQHIMVAVERPLVELMIHQSQVSLSS